MNSQQNDSTMVMGLFSSLRARFGRQPRNWYKPIVHPFLKRRPAVAKPRLKVAFIALEYAHVGDKVTVSLFHPIFDAVMRRHGIVTDFHASPVQFLKTQPSACPCVAVLLYREAKYDIAAVAQIEQRIADAAPETIIVHGSGLGRIIGSKRSYNQLVTAAGVPMPSLVGGKTSEGPVFSNEDHSSRADILVLPPGAPLPEERYNTDLIDTVHNLDGINYYVYVRALAVAGVCTAVYVSFRPVSEGSPSVHMMDTPLNPDVINRLSLAVRARYEPEIRRHCTTLGSVLGLGFYAHDFLPCEKTRSVYLCESTFRLSAGQGIRKHLWPIRNEIPGYYPMFSQEETLRTADAFLLAIENDSQATHCDSARREVGVC